LTNIVFIFVNNLPFRYLCTMTTIRENRRVIIAWWKKREENRFEVFSSLRVFCNHYPRFNYNTVSNYLSKQKTAFETDEIMIERKAITQKAGAVNKPDLPARLFWEFDYDKMDWVKSYRTVISRVIERGTDKDWKVMVDYYGRKKIIHALKNEITFLSDHAIQKVADTFKIKPEELKCYKRKQSRRQHWL
jgi:hypothetical protein